METVLHGRTCMSPHSTAIVVILNSGLVLLSVSQSIILAPFQWHEFSITYKVANELVTG